MQRPLFFIFAALLALGGCAGTNTRQSTGEYFDDSLITNRVKSALLYERGVTSTKINVETFRGVVLLSGFVDSHDIVAKAVNATKHVEFCARSRAEIRSGRSPRPCPSRISPAGCGARCASG